MAGRGGAGGARRGMEAGRGRHVTFGPLGLFNLLPLRAYWPMQPGAGSSSGGVWAGGGLRVRQYACV